MLQERAGVLDRLRCCLLHCKVLTASNLKPQYSGLPQCTYARPTPSSASRSRPTCPSSGRPANPTSVRQHNLRSCAHAQDPQPLSQSRRANIMATSLFSLAESAHFCTTRVNAPMPSKAIGLEACGEFAPHVAVRVVADLGVQVRWRARTPYCKLKRGSDHTATRNLLTLAMTRKYCVEARAGSDALPSSRSRLSGPLADCTHIRRIATAGVNRPSGNATVQRLCVCTRRMWGLILEGG